MNLRARNRRAAMRTIQGVAVRRFTEEGFDQVTVEEIAEEAGVSPSTLYRYFGTKEDLVVWDELDSRVEAALENHLGKTPPFEALHRSFVEAYGGLDRAELEALGRRAALIDLHADLLTAQIAQLEQGRVELIEALAAVYRRPPTDVVLDLTARFALAALIAGIERWQATGTHKSVQAWIDESFCAASSAVSSAGA